jgi:uncharacterized membrane protein
MARHSDSTAHDFKIDTILNAEEEKPRPSAVTIGKPVDQVFRYLRDFSNFTHFSRGNLKVTAVSPAKAHWSFNILEDGGNRLQSKWDTEIIAEEPNKLIAWRTSDDAEFGHFGLMTFAEAPGNRGTVVTLKFENDPKKGKIRGATSYLIGHDPKPLSYIMLRDLKALLETGEVPTTAGQPTGRDTKEAHSESYMLARTT